MHLLFLSGISASLVSSWGFSSFALELSSFTPSSSRKIGNAVSWYFGDTNLKIRWKVWKNGELWSKLLEHLLWIKSVRTDPVTSADDVPRSSTGKVEPHELYACWAMSWHVTTCHHMSPYFAYFASISVSTSQYVSVLFGRKLAKLGRSSCPTGSKHISAPSTSTKPLKPEPPVGLQDLQGVEVLKESLNNLYVKDCQRTCQASSHALLVLFFNLL